MRHKTFGFIKMSLILLLKHHFQKVTEIISSCRYMVMLNLCCSAIINNIYSQTICCSQRAKVCSNVFQDTHTEYPWSITLLALRLGRANKKYERFMRWNIVMISKRKICVIITIHKRNISLAGKCWSPMKGWSVFCWILQAKLQLPLLLFSSQQYRYSKGLS